MKIKLIGYTLGALVLLVWVALSGSMAETSYKGCFGVRLNDIGQGPVAWSEWVGTPSRKRQPYRNPWRGYGLSRKRWRRYQRRLRYLMDQRRTREESGCRSEPEEERGSVTEMLTAMVVKMPAVNLEMGSSWVWWTIESVGRWG
ncbi:MAG: hypothetical protein GY934_17800 [Gammaproteobacteria bacterium]|nr:hypothetical protein [Gammaproteobacteria bacterium]